MKTKIALLALAVASFTAQANNGNKVQQQQIDDLRASLHQVHMNTLQKYSESWGLEDRANIAKLQDTKVDKTAQAATDARQTGDLKGYADKKATSAYTTAVVHTDVKVARADADRKAGDDALSERITAGVAAQSDRDASQDTHINAVQNAAQAANESAGKLSSAVQQTNAQLAVTDQRSQHTAVRADKLEEGQRAQDRQMGGDRQQRVDADKALDQQITTSSAYAQSRIDAANANIEANRSALVSRNKRIAANTAQLANHEQRLNDMQQQNNRQFADMGKRIDKVQDKANAGTATALAAAGIPQVTGEQRFSLGAAVGGYESENALAVGFSSRVSQNVVVKASVATDTQHGVGYNVGASVGW